MRGLTRYVLAEFLKVFLLTLTAMTLFMLVLVVAREALRQGLGFGPLLRLTPYGLPEALRFAVPATTLLSICSVYGRMSADNEIVAVKSVGISPMVMAYPALVLTFLVSIVAVWMNDLSVSWGEPGIRRVIVESVEQIAYRMLRARGNYATERFSIRVDGVEGQTLLRPSVFVFAPDGAPETTITAEKAVLRRNPSDDSLEISLTAGRFESTRSDGVYEYAFDGEETRVVPLLDEAEIERWSSRPSNLPLHRVPAAIEKQRSHIKQRQQAMAALAGSRLFMGDFHELREGSWLLHESRLQADTQRLEQLRAVPWRRWANGFSCFFFAMVGLPMAIRARSANLFTTFASCFMPILLVYYPLMAYGVDRAKCGALPPYAVWMGNAVCLLVAVLLLRRMLRH